MVYDPQVGGWCGARGRLDPHLVYHVLPPVGNPAVSAGVAQISSHPAWMESFWIGFLGIAISANLATSSVVKIVNDHGTLFLFSDEPELIRRHLRQPPHFPLSWLYPHLLLRYPENP